MEIKRNLSFGETLRINLDGDFNIILKSSTVDIGFIFQSSTPDEFDITHSSESIEIINKHRSEQQREDLDKLISQLDTSHGISGIIKSGISSVQKIIERTPGASKTNHATIILTINHDHTKNIYIKSSNLILQADHTNLSLLKLKSGNAKIDIQENNTIENIKLNASNMKGTLFFGEKTPKLKIEANNGKIDIVRQQAFEGLVVCNGNNLKASGYLGKSSSVGLCDILMNNGKISIRS